MNKYAPVLLYKFLVGVLVMLLCQASNAQFISAYGVTLGVTNARENWTFSGPISANLEYSGLTRPAGFIYAEKKLNKTFILRSQLGYFQKGYTDNSPISDDEGNYLERGDNTMNSHLIVVDFRLNIKPFQSATHIYGVAGIRNDFRVAVDGMDVFYQNGNRSPKYINSWLEKGEQPYNLGAIIGIGVEFKSSLYIEFEYNPAITALYKGPVLEIRSHVFGLFIGYSISSLLNK